MEDSNGGVLFYNFFSLPLGCISKCAFIFDILNKFLCPFFGVEK